MQSKSKPREPDMKNFFEMFKIQSTQSSEAKMSNPKVTQEKLEELFKMVDFKPNETLRKEITNYFTKKRDGEKEITYDDFLKLFSLKENTELPKVRVKNAFRMLCKEYSSDKDEPRTISYKRLSDLLDEIGVEEVEKAALLGQLKDEFNDKQIMDFDDYIERQY